MRGKLTIKNIKSHPIEWEKILVESGNENHLAEQEMHMLAVKKASLINTEASRHTGRHQQYLLHSPRRLSVELGRPQSHLGFPHKVPKPEKKDLCAITLLREAVSRNG